MAYPPVAAGARRTEQCLDSNCLLLVTGCLEGIRVIARTHHECGSTVHRASCRCWSPSAGTNSPWESAPAAHTVVGTCQGSPSVLHPLKFSLGGARR